MAKITLGSTGICVEQMAFGALPIQRDTTDVAVKLLRRAYEGGMRFFDTARMYTDSEEKMGIALADMGIRDEIYIASKFAGNTVEGFWRDLNTTLTNLKTDYIDIYQFHNPKQVYRPGDGTGLYEAMLEAKARGMIRHIGFTNHSVVLANEAVDSGLYETLQFPFSYLTGEQELKLVAKCKEKNVGFIAMKALAGGLINNGKAAAAYMAQFDNVLPIWGVQHDYELEEFLSYIDNPPATTAELQAIIDHDRAELTGDFCRGCGYCMPCPAGIEINNSARMSLLLRRAPAAPYLTTEWKEKMERIENCIGCGKCVSKCPYGLNTPELLRKNLADYREVYAKSL